MSILFKLLFLFSICGRLKNGCKFFGALPTKKWSLISLLLNLPKWLVSPTECGGSDVLGFLRVGLKKSCSFYPASWDSLSDPWAVVKEFWLPRDSHAKVGGSWELWWTVPPEPAFLSSHPKPSWTSHPALLIYTWVTSVDAIWNRKDQPSAAWIPDPWDYEI